MTKTCTLPSCVANIYSTRLRWNEKPPCMHSDHSLRSVTSCSHDEWTFPLYAFEREKKASLSFVSFHAIFSFLLLYPQLVAISGEKANNITRVCSPDYDPIALLRQQKTQHLSTQTAANVALSEQANSHVWKVGELRQHTSSWKHDFCLLKCS